MFSFSIVCFNPMNPRVSGPLAAIACTYAKFAKGLSFPFYFHSSCDLLNKVEWKNMIHVANAGNLG